MAGGGVTIIGTKPSYSRKTSDLEVDQYRFMKNAGYFASVRNIPLLPWPNKRETAPENDDLDNLKKSINLYKDNDIHSRIANLREINRRSSRDTDRILNHIETCTTLRGRTLKALQADVCDARNENQKSKAEKRPSKEHYHECTTSKLTGFSKSATSRKSSVENSIDPSEKKSTVREEEEDVSKKVSDASTGTNRTSSHKETPSEEEMAKIMEKYLAKSSEGSLEKSVSEPCLSSITPSSQWSSSTSSKGTQHTKNRTQKRRLATESRGTQTDHLIYIEISMKSLDAGAREEASTETESQSHSENTTFWPDRRDLIIVSESGDDPARERHTVAPKVINYDTELLHEKLNNIWTKNRSLKSLPEIPDVLPALSVTLALDQETGENVLLRSTYYYDMYAGLLQDDTGMQKQIAVRMYKKDACQWDDALREVSFLKILQDTGTVPQVRGIICMDFGNSYWPTASVFNTTCCVEGYDDQMKIMTLGNFLRCSEGTAQHRGMSKPAWIRLCMNLTEKVRLLHHMHVIPLDLDKDNILLQIENGHLNPCFFDFLHSLYDHGKSTLEIDTRRLPLRSLTMLSLQQSEWTEPIILRRKRNINTKALGFLFASIGRLCNISLNALARQCKRENPVSRPTLPCILEKLAEVGMKYEDRSRMMRNAINSCWSWKRDLSDFTSKISRNKIQNKNTELS